MNSGENKTFTISLTVVHKLGGPTQRVLLRFHKLRTTTDIANDKLTITIFARKNLPATAD